MTCPDLSGEPTNVYYSHIVCFIGAHDLVYMWVLVVFAKIYKSEKQTLPVTPTYNYIKNASYCIFYSIFANVI